MPNRFTSKIIKEGAGTTPSDPLTVIIPVAGMGHRMKSYGPKCLLPANTKETILDKTIANVEREYPYSDIIVVVGFESEKVIKSLPHNIRIVEKFSYKSLKGFSRLTLAPKKEINEFIKIFKSY